MSRSLDTFNNPLESRSLTQIHMPSLCFIYYTKSKRPNNQRSHDQPKLAPKANYQIKISQFSGNSIGLSNHSRRSAKGIEDTCDPHHPNDCDFHNMLLFCIPARISPHHLRMNIRASSAATYYSCLDMIHFLISMRVLSKQLSARPCLLYRADRCSLWPAPSCLRLHRLRPNPRLLLL